MSENVNPGRRDVLRGLIGTIAAMTLNRARALGLAPVPSGIKVPTPGLSAAGTAHSHFFTPEEREMVATVADLIIPSDEVSAGARTAGVHDWIDFVVANSPPEVQARWRDGLAALDHASAEAKGGKFATLDSRAQRELLLRLAEHEDSPSTAAEHFFVLAKEAAVNGYYTSEIGLMRDLKYQGASYVDGPEDACPAMGTPSATPPKHPRAAGHPHSSPKGH